MFATSPGGWERRLFSHTADPCSQPFEDFIFEPTDGHRAELNPARERAVPFFAPDLGVGIAGKLAQPRLADDPACVVPGVFWLGQMLRSIACDGAQQLVSLITDFERKQKAIRAHFGSGFESARVACFCMLVGAHYRPSQPGAMSRRSQPRILG